MPKIDVIRPDSGTSEHSLSSFTIIDQSKFSFMLNFIRVDSSSDTAIERSERSEIDSE